MRSEGEVVVLLPREAREVVDDNEVDLALVGTTVLEKILELATIGRLRALAFFVKALLDFISLPSAILLTGAELGRQAEVLSLLFRADANVDHRADHRRQLRLILGDEQDASAGHVHLLRRRAVLQEDLDERMGHRIRVLANEIDVLIRQIVRLVAQELATTRNRDRIWPSVCGIHVVHSSRAFRALEPSSRCLGFARESAPTRAGALVYGGADAGVPPTSIRGSCAPRGGGSHGDHRMRAPSTRVVTCAATCQSLPSATLVLGTKRRR